jgi:hypothetical protein
MARPTLLDVLNEVAAAKAALDTLFSKLRALAPADLQTDLDAAKAVLDTALANFDVVGASQDLSQVVQVLKSFGGIVGPGADTDLNP